VQFQGELIGQGRDAAVRALTESPELAGKLKEAVLAARPGMEPAEKTAKAA
jgi:hypothetical protein